MCVIFDETELELYQMSFNRAREQKQKNINKNCTSVYTVEIVQINFKIHAYFPEFIGEGG